MALARARERKTLCSRFVDVLRLLSLRGRGTSTERFRGRFRRRGTSRRAASHRMRAMPSTSVRRARRHDSCARPGSGVGEGGSRVTRRVIVPAARHAAVCFIGRSSVRPAPVAVLRVGGRVPFPYRAFFGVASAARGRVAAASGALRRLL